ncbi:hypothetical protein FNO01nite_30350 [Flavobacterium noncentrifugens]|uniref:Phage virion morphogenesis family protein n=1 Tax=Flavobacterium noncentrifugens TaxID=1128970 RepID=A0A1G9BTT9_9FLAO|nr:phage virion morphogenesis protein [Flavobacterium noncentrifugens]GEP52363.1 hypothetical protein FNO01nite_30350 [Flavobacterium noncentrifugens]SDK42803.1 Phage virion morphogenesis family protein [Flavobacterium noncentrifugens]
MTIKDLENNITQDVAIELHEAFDRNFERRAFFDEAWIEPKLANSRGSVMNRSGNLRRSIRYSVQANQILFSSSLPYASIHNSGGEIEVTQKMKSFFWAMYYKAAGAILFNVKSKGMAKTKKNVRLSKEAEQWKALALMKIGHKIKIEKRQIIGEHPQVTKIVKDVIDEHMQLFNQEYIKKFKR